MNAIYHPSYLPDHNWYKTQLLVWDEIFRIVPYSVEDRFGARRISEIWEVPEDYVPTIDLRMPDHQFFEDRKKVILKQLKHLSKLPNKNFDEDEQFYLNSAKIPEWVAKSLKNYRLRKKRSSAVWGAKHFLVRADASDFLMNCVAYGLSSNLGMSLLTDRKSSCFVTYANQIGLEGEAKPSGDNYSCLLAGVFDIMVPGNIDILTFEDIIEIRNEYGPLRKSVNNCLKAISDEFNLTAVIDDRRGEALIQDSLEEFRRELERFERSSLKRLFTDWRTLSLGSSVAILGALLAGGPSAAIGCAVGSGGVTLLNQLVSANTPSNIQNTVQYFSQINERIDRNTYIDEFVNYRRLILGE